MNGSTAESSAFDAGVQQAGRFNKVTRPSIRVWSIGVLALLGAVLNLVVVSNGFLGSRGAIITLCATGVGTLVGFLWVISRNIGYGEAATASSSVNVATNNSQPEKVGEALDGDAVGPLTTAPLPAGPLESQHRPEADRVSHAESDFLARVSHEARTPLSALTAVADLLAETQLDETQRKYVEVFRAGSQHLSDLMTDMLDFSQIQTGFLRLEFSDFDLPAFVDDLVRMIQPLANQKRIRLSSTVDEAVSRSLKGHPQRIRQVLVGLLGNAVKFTEKGSISLRVSASADLDCTGAAQPHRTLRFDVTDTGAGIPAAELNKIISTFEAPKGSSDHEITAHGLGLALSKLLADAMGGRMLVRSASGFGTTFSLLVPMLPATGQSAPAPREKRLSVQAPPSEPSTLENVKLLLVISPEGERKPLNDELTALGCQVTAVDGALPALLALARAIEAQEPFKLVVIDGRLSRVTGVETAQRLAAQEWAGNPGIVVLTAGLTEDDLEGQSELKARLFGGDPLDVALLKSELSAALLSAKVPPPSAPALARRVLVVDDNSTNLFLVKDFLKRVPGIDVEAVDGGEVAVERATATRFDLILMDMQMPVVDGRTATRRIRQFERDHDLPSVPIIAFTAHSLDIELAEATAAGCNGHLIKPAKKQKVIETVLSYLNAANGPASQERTPPATSPAMLPIRALGNERFRDHTGNYLLRLAESLTQADAALRDHDLSTVKEISHKWIGPGVGLGLPEISDEGGLLQNAARSLNEPLIEAQLAMLRDYTRRLHVVFEGGVTIRPIE